MSEPRQFRVGEESAGARLDDFLAARLSGLSRMRIASLLARGRCTVNGGAATAGRRVGAGDLVEFEPGADAPNSMTPEPAPLEIVYEDAHLLVVVKPAGLLVHPTLGVKRGTLANALAYHLNRELIDEGAAVEDSTVENSAVENSILSTRSFTRPGIVHRLDRETSGLLAVAKTRASLSRLSQHFQRRLVEKRYVAVVGGVVAADELTIDAPVGRDESARPPWGVTPDGKQAETRLRVAERGARRTLVELEPVTGRTNQLRIHCAHAGHAIVGDAPYGGEPHARLCLHASRLAFRHPATNEPVEFVSDAPAGLLSAFD